MQSSLSWIHTSELGRQQWMYVPSDRYSEATTYMTLCYSMLDIYPSVLQTLPARDTMNITQLHWGREPGQMHSTTTLGQRTREKMLTEPLCC